MKEQASRRERASGPLAFAWAPFKAQGDIPAACAIVMSFSVSLQGYNEF